jgi:hypothetical protein
MFENIYYIILLIIVVLLIGYHKAIKNYKNIKRLKSDHLYEQPYDRMQKIIDKNPVINKIDKELADINKAQIPKLKKIKNSSALNYIEDEKLRQEIQYYANNAAVLKTREQREYSFVDKYIDPLSISTFDYKYLQELSKHDRFEIKGDKVITPIKAPNGLKLVNQTDFDWNNYLSVLGMLSTIRKSTDRSQILPIKDDCIKLLGLVRSYLEEHNALID